MSSVREGEGESQLTDVQLTVKEMREKLTHAKASLTDAEAALMDWVEGGPLTTIKEAYKGVLDLEQALDTANNLHQATASVDPSNGRVVRTEDNVHPVIVWSMLKGPYDDSIPYHRQVLDIDAKDTDGQPARFDDGEYIVDVGEDFRAEGVTIKDRRFDIGPTCDALHKAQSLYFGHADYDHRCVEYLRYSPERDVFVAHFGS